MLKRLYDYAILFKEYFLLALFLILSVALFARNNTNQVRAIRSSTLAATGVLQDVFGFVPGYFALRHDNRVLRELNLTLSDEVNRLRESRLENIRLRQMLGLKERPVFPYISARVVGAQVQAGRNTLTIDAGERSGARMAMPVVTDQGLAGKVIATSSGFSVVQLLLHKDMRVSARVQRSRVNGIIRWNAGRMLQLMHVPKTLDVQTGDMIITSEFSSIFPPGIRIGVVSATRQIPGELFQVIDVSPSVDFGRLEEVFVAAFTPDSSRVALQRRLQE
jgi:rod shape-determining protein MreC